MSIPTYTIPSDSSLKFDIPAGWYTQVIGVSRKNYQQLYSLEYGSSKNKTSVYLFSNQRGLQEGVADVNKKMREFSRGTDNQIVDSGRNTMILNFDFYFSEKETKYIPSLQDDQYRSNSIQVIPARSAADYVLFMVFVEDAPASVQPGKRYDDLLVTIHSRKRRPDDPEPGNPSTKYPLHDIQAEIVPGLTKAFEYFYFFTISNLPHFRRVVKDWALHRIWTAQRLVDNPAPNSGKPVPDNKDVGLSLGFTSIGLKLFGLTDSLQDDAFSKGQRLDAKELGDRGAESGGVFMPEWEPAFQGDIHGIFQITAFNDESAKAFIIELENAFNINATQSSIKKILNLRATFRPDPYTVKEHFGFRDGISRPEIEGVTFFNIKNMRFAGAPIVDIGLIVMGLDGDEDKATRPAWAVNGSFLVFRKLKQLVPEYHDFALREGKRLFANLSPQKAADRLGARLFGRWPSGTPLVLAPEDDDPKIAANNDLLNNFDYDTADQKVCPFSAHTRKSFSRSDTADSKKHLFRRASIPYGDEVTLAEEQQRKTIQDRGLIFVCYQSSIERGFKFIQKTSMNNPNYPPGKRIRPGYDPISGATGKEVRDVWRYTTGANPNSLSYPLDFPLQFVVPNGGEYFFLPSISTLRDRIAL